MDGFTNGLLMDEWIDGKLDELMDGRMDEWMDKEGGWMYEWINCWIYA